MVMQPPIRIWLSLGLAGAALASYAPVGSDARPVACPADGELANLVAASDHILIARMEFPPSLLADGGMPRYLELPLSVQASIKGGQEHAASLLYFPSSTPYYPSPDALTGLIGEPALLFLTQIDDDPPQLYFAGNSSGALRPADRLTVKAVRQEVARQSGIADNWRPDPSHRYSREVSGLISQLGVVEGYRQQQVFDSLVDLGSDAVPAIVSQMDDRRPLRTQAISLENRSPDAFEATRHYGPEQVVDGLDAVLQQITGASFGTIVNGGSERERAATIAGWRVYASDQGCPAV